MNQKTKEIYSEVYSIINTLGKEYANKLPMKLYNIIEENRLEGYNPQYKSIDLKNQKIKRESLAMIALFYLNYWCDSKEEKQQLKELFNSNEQKYKKEIEEKYDIKFNKKKEQKAEERENQTDLIVYKEPIFKRIIKNIKQYMKKIFRQ
ncbi:MAG: hypothetical protein HFJ49_00275 [Clostridia bacterium]|nr:hypothetical protein [Clostridia bacterium]